MLSHALLEHYVRVWTTTAAIAFQLIHVERGV